MNGLRDKQTDEIDKRAYQDSRRLSNENEACALLFLSRVQPPARIHALVVVRSEKNKKEIGNRSEHALC